MQAHMAAATLTHATNNHVSFNELSKKLEQHEITPSSYKNKCNITEPSALDTPVTAGDHLGCTLIWQSESTKKQNKKKTSPKPFKKHDNNIVTKVGLKDPLSLD